MDVVLKEYRERRALFKKFGYDFAKEHNAIISRMMPCGGEILEVGTGKGYFASFLSGKKKSFISIDNSRVDRRGAQANIKAFGGAGLARLVTADAEDMPFKAERFDLVFSVNALHHFGNPLKVFSECLRVIRPGGKIVIADFSLQGFKMLDEIHAAEGKTHDSGCLSVEDAALYFRLKYLKCKVIKRKFQHILLVSS